MIKPDDIKKHTAEFFTSDPDFVLWCLDPERAQDGYWCGYTERHPQDLVEFERAVSLVRRVGKTHPALPSVEKQLLLDRILTDHYARRRFAAPPRRRNRTALFAAASLLVAGVVAALFWSADFTGSGLPSAEAYENITLVTREGSREVYDDIARISLTPKGEILIDGRPAGEYRLRALRRRIGYIGQTGEFLTGTLAANLLLGVDRPVPETRLREVIGLVGLGARLNAPECDRDAPLEENGVNFSVGERIRLAVAREILRDPDILILDETTASLDGETEEKLMDFLLELLAGRTVLVISHRESTLRRAQRRLELKEGRIYEK